jgi:sulfide:quinone oxidoreductase
MSARVLVLGAGFGGLELSTILSERLGAAAEVTIIDKGDAFVLGYSKLDVMFGRATLDGVRLRYRKFAKPGVRFLRETIVSIDPAGRRVATDVGIHDCDHLVVALGADYDLAATPGLESVNEFYSVAGAHALRDILPTFSKGRALVGVCGAPYKCPPAPSECAFLLHDFLTKKGVRDKCEITVALPLPSPVPPSPDTSKALIAAFGERNIMFMPNRRIAEVDSGRRVAKLDDGEELPYDLFLGVPKHRAPAVVEASGMTEGEWVTVNPRTLETKHANVYAIGDIANTGTPKAGVFAEAAAKAVASSLIRRIRGEGESHLYSGAGSCYIEFGGGRVGRVDVDFFSGPKPTGTYHEPNLALRADKDAFGSVRRARWFAL